MPQNIQSYILWHFFYALFVINPIEILNSGGHVCHDGIGKDEGCHGFEDRCNAGRKVFVVTSLDLHGAFVTFFVDCLLRKQYRGNGFDRSGDDDVIAVEMPPRMPPA